MSCDKDFSMTLPEDVQQKVQLWIELCTKEESLKRAQELKEYHETKFKELEKFDRLAGFAPAKHPNQKANQAKAFRNRVAKRRRKSRK